MAIKFGIVNIYCTFAIDLVTHYYPASEIYMAKKQLLFKLIQVFALSCLLIFNGLLLKYILEQDFFTLSKNKKQAESSECLTSKENFMGFDLNHFEISKSKIKTGQLLPEILSDYGVASSKINQIIENLNGILDVKSIKAGNSYAMIHSNVCVRPDYFVYEINQYKSLLCDLSLVNCPIIIEKEREFRRELVGGTIKSSLWNALEEQGVSLGIIDQMEDALATSMDFHQIQLGNSFKLIFNRVWIEGEPTNEGDLIAAYFNTDRHEHFAFKYEVNNKKDYYDLNGRPLRRSFLQAPLRFSRISSPFNTKRFHPVLKYSRPHFGTDYAAPTGTPIMSVGEGVVTAASYTGGNGNFVKIRHDKTYETQYLHMSRFASGIRPGTHVNQGQIIGYVGSTGLATGPHVCFRFWKNGVQVDHRKLSFPAGLPLPGSILSDYLAFKDKIMAELNTITNESALVNSTNSKI